MPPLDDKAPSFEDNMDALSKLVERMERGELPLEDALGAFEEGNRLVARCKEQLADVGMKVEAIVNAGGDTAPFSVKE